MEEQRIGMMYVNLLKRRLSDLWYRLFGNGLRRSALLPFLVVGLLVALPLGAFYLHRRGRFHTLKNEIKGDAQAVPTSGDRPGGVDPLVLSRVPTPNSVEPELVSATLLPGLGMGVLQVVAQLPGRGNVALLSAPSVTEMADGSLPPRTSLYDTRGALELPWGGILAGAITPVGSTMSVKWHDRTIELPTQVLGRATAEGGLLGDRGVDSVEGGQPPNAVQASAVMANTDFNGHWPSRTDIRLQSRLEPQGLTLTLSARNAGSQPEPMGMGWHPRLRILGDRGAVELWLPHGERMQVADPTRGTPSGKAEALDGVAARMQLRPSAPGSETLNETLVTLKPSAGDAGPAIEYRDVKNAYGLRLTTLEGPTRVVRVVAPADAQYVSVGMQTNMDDPFGKEWLSAAEQPIATLLPGQSMVWKIRLEIFALPAR